MTTQAAIALTTNIADVPGVGTRRAPGFRKLSIRSVADLLRHLPMRHEHELPEQSIEAAGKLIGPNHNAEANIAVVGDVAVVRGALSRRTPFTATLQDSSGTIKLSWFNSPWMKGKLHPGMRIRVSGKAKRYGDYIEMANPKWELVDPEKEHSVRAERYAPIYPATEGTPSSVIEQAVSAILEPALALLEDHLSLEYRRSRALPALADAYRMIHKPNDEDEIKQARRRLAFDELLLLQLGVMMKRHHRREAMTALPLKLTPAIDKRILARFPFEITPSQREVIDEVATDLQTTRPMNRLVQGDVGSGKTVVALYAMLMAVASGHQAALMAPTELLAEQHFASITRMLTGGTSRVRIESHTGSLKSPQRKTILKRLEAGEIDLLIGTHALLSEGVNFKSLAVAVIDEQHRFGVHQRALLRGRTSPSGGEVNTIPHMLVMTATPIPRTLSLTVFGDLDISTIKSLPPGRKPIITKHVPQAKAIEVYTYIAEKLADGHQAYIVVPVIDETATALKDVKSHLDWLAKGPLTGRRLAAMHGRLKREERDVIMNQFRAGEIDALIATTVIEVGVDVPNASIMVIEHADRFGLAQLHQLRGRIGRGARRSLCVLIADTHPEGVTGNAGAAGKSLATDDGAARIEAMLSTTDGFKIAEKDFEIRGPGELFGTRQSGSAGFRLVEFPRDTELLRLARRDAENWINRNPTLAGEADALLRRRLLKAHGESLGLGDVA
jgi:ATP-dependent DNA helicase RecG